MTDAADSQLPQRKAPVHLTSVSPGDHATIYFVTICTQNRRPLLASPEAQAILIQAWTSADNFLVGRYMILPDHIHFFCTPAFPDSPSLMNWMSYWKSLAARHCPNAEGEKLWQREFWDTQLRASDSYSAKWQYVLENPVRAGLVNKSEDWPYQGELNLLPWHD